MEEPTTVKTDTGTTLIHYNGSKWNGQEPDSVDRLIEMLSHHPIGAWFFKEGVGHMAPDSDLGRGTIRYFGNFEDVSHAFCIETNDADVIRRMNAAVRTSFALARAA